MQECLERNHLVGKNALLVAGVSGGPDSLALLYSLLSVKDDLRLRVHVAHLNHNFRGQEADEDARFVENVARTQNLSATVERIDPVAYQKERRISSFEAAARDVRYTFLGKVVRQSRGVAVALGHTSDDQVETVLMHLLRGSGLHGLRGMEELTTWRSPIDSTTVTLLRPLLDVGREETLAYCQERGISFRTDSANLSMRFTRNRVRHRLLPTLTHYNPRIRQSLLRLSHTVSHELQYLEWEVSRLWPTVAQERNRLLILDTRALETYHHFIQRLILRRAYAHLAGDARRLEEVHINSMQNLIGAPAGKLLTLPGGLKLSTSYGAMLLGRDPQTLCPFPTLDGPYQLKVPGLTVVSGWQIKAAFLSQAPAQTSNTPYTAYLDADTVGGDLWFKTRRPGDRFHPLGMPGLKKLQDFFVDSKVPRLWRDRVPLVVSEVGIAWVVGYRIAHWAAARTNSQGVLHLHATCDTLTPEL